MKNLYLVRHAKSSWKLPVDDLKRPLKKRGILDAILISDHIKKLVSKPDFLLTSDAERAHSTAIYFKKAFKILKLLNFISFNFMFAIKTFLFFKEYSTEIVIISLT